MTPTTTKPTTTTPTTYDDTNYNNTNYKRKRIQNHFHNNTTLLKPRRLPFILIEFLPCLNSVIFNQIFVWSSIETSRHLGLHFSLGVWLKKCSATSGIVRIYYTLLFILLFNQISVLKLHTFKKLFSTLF